MRTAGRAARRFAPGPRASAAAATDIGSVRQYNEDRSLVEYHHGDLVVAVADGVGGEHGGDVASEAAVNALAQAYLAQPRRDLGRALAAAMRTVNDAVLGAAGKRGVTGAATTLVAAAIRGRRVAIANLGDSRAYLLRRDLLRQVTTNHSGAARRSITRFAGDPRGVQPDVFLEDLWPGDRLLLCSDGVTIHLGEQDLVPLLREGDAENAARQIVRAAVAAGGEDNATAVVVVSAPLMLRWDFVILWAVVGAAILAVATTLLVLAPR